MTGHLRLLACNGHCAIALLPAQQLLGINSSPIQNGESRESPVVGVVLENVYCLAVCCDFKTTATDSARPFCACFFCSNFYLLMLNI